MERLKGAPAQSSSRLWQIHHFRQLGPARTRAQGFHQSSSGVLRREWLALFDGSFIQINRGIDYTRTRKVKNRICRRAPDGGLYRFRVCAAGEIFATLQIEQQPVDNYSEETFRRRMSGSPDVSTYRDREAKSSTMIKSRLSARRLSEHEWLAPQM